MLINEAGSQTEQNFSPAGALALLSRGLNVNGTGSISVLRV